MSIRRLSIQDQSLRLNFLPATLLRNPGPHTPCHPLIQREERLPYEVLHPQQFVPGDRVARRYEFRPQCPDPALAGGARDGAEAEAAIEAIDRPHGRD
jgi:hypothetical protein